MRNMGMANALIPVVPRVPSASIGWTTFRTGWPRIAKLGRIEKCARLDAGATESPSLVLVVIQHTREHPSKKSAHDWP
jgi:hypothetical protein